MCLTVSHQPRWLASLAIVAIVVHRSPSTPSASRMSSTLPWSALCPLSSREMSIRDFPMSRATRSWFMLCSARNARSSIPSRSRRTYGLIIVGLPDPLTVCPPVKRNGARASKCANSPLRCYSIDQRNAPYLAVAIKASQAAAGNSSTGPCPCSLVSRTPTTRSPAATCTQLPWASL